MAASTTMDTVANLLKEVYENKVVDQLQNDVITHKRIERDSSGITNKRGGKYVAFAIRTKRNHGIGARRENEALPTARTQGYEDVEVRLKNLYGAISLTGQAFDQAETDEQAFASALSQEVDGMKENLIKDVNRQTYGTTAGVIGTITAVTTSATHTFADGVQYFEEGMVVDILTSAGVLKVEEIEVESVDSSANTVTFSESFTSAANDIVTRWRSYNKELTGFADIVSDTSTLFGINPTDVPIWKAVVDDNSGTPRAVSEGLFIQMVDKIRQKGGKTTAIYTTLGVRRAYYALLQQQRRFQGSKNFQGGFEGLAFATDWGEIPMIADFDAPAEKAWFMNEKALKIRQNGEWAWMNRDGNMWQRIMTSEGTFDAYEAHMYKYCELETDRRNTHGLLADLQEATS